MYSCKRLLWWIEVNGRKDVCLELISTLWQRELLDVFSMFFLVIGGCGCTSVVMPPSALDQLSMYLWFAFPKFCLRVPVKICLSFHHYLREDIMSMPLADPRRQKARDDKLWKREFTWATQHGVDKMRCPCAKCEGRGRLVLLRTVRDHLVLNGRHPLFRVWKGPGQTDHSDEE